MIAAFIAHSIWRDGLAVLFRVRVWFGGGVAMVKIFLAELFRNFGRKTFPQKMIHCTSSHWLVIR
jgi:hypothetical protein